jgi:hypothetical protein
LSSKYTFHILDVFSSTPFGGNIETEARKIDGVVTSLSVGGAAARIASGEIEVPQSALVS